MRSRTRRRRWFSADRAIGRCFRLLWPHAGDAAASSTGIASAADAPVESEGDRAATATG